MVDVVKGTKPLLTCVVQPLFKAVTAWSCTQSTALYTERCLPASLSNITTALEVYDNMHVKRKEKIMRFSD